LLGLLRDALAPLIHRGVFGLGVFPDAALRLEKAGAAGDLNDADALCWALEREVERLLDALADLTTAGPSAVEPCARLTTNVVETEHANPHC